MTGAINGTPLRLLTLNVWALPVTIPGQFKADRTARLPGALRSIDADLIVLQEAFDTRVRRDVVAALPGYHIAEDALASRRMFGVTLDVHGGILVLSRFPIRDARFVHHPLPVGSKLSERLGRKGALISTIETPEGPCTLVAPHFYAGTAQADARIREEQLLVLLAHLDAVDRDAPVIVAGDLNFPPHTYDDGRPSEMRLLTEAGFRDALSTSSGAESPTWSYSRNRYARNWLQTHKSDMRFDYILWRAGLRSTVEPASARIVLDTVGEEVSDHYGVVADLSVNGPPVSG